jgi:hypothetical protein
VANCAVAQVFQQNNHYQLIFAPFHFRFDFSNHNLQIVKNQGTFLQGGEAYCMVFGTFSKMISGMPIQAVLKTLDLECRMLAEDLECHRLSSREDALSILSFGEFVRMVKAGEMVHRLKTSPPDHLEFYKETVVRLVNANELPKSAMEQFEQAFSLIV